MKKIVLLTVLLLLLASSTRWMEPSRGYIEVREVTVRFNGTDATFNVNYHLSGAAKLYTLFLGSKTLEPAVKNFFSDFPEVELLKMDSREAVVLTRNVTRLEGRFYLHDSRNFSQQVNRLIVYRPDSPRPTEHFNVNATPNTFWQAET